jgi:hypothetical protein
MIYSWLILLVVAAFIGGEIHGHSRGVDTTEAVYAAQAAEAERENRLLFRQSTRRAQEITDGYIKAKNVEAASAAAARDELQRLRDTLAQRGGAAGSADAALGAAGAGEREVLGSCASALADMGREADRLAGKLTALQAWVGGVCARPPD